MLDLKTNLIFTSKRFYCLNNIRVQGKIWKKNRNGIG